MSAQSKTVKLTPNAKTYYPEGYYKRVGYQKSEAASSNARVDALGQRVRDRFNEEFTEEKARASGGLHHRTLKQLKQAHKSGGGPASQASRYSADVFSQNKRRSVAPTPSKMGGMHAPDQASMKEKAMDVQSVITLDRLKKFNDI